MKSETYEIAAYCRLSKDDESAGESGSISTQKELIRQYCESNHWTIKEFYVDDGWSGTNFDRPDFKRMIADIESGKINMVITKDLSRLGRDYIMSGYYTEVYFPENQVRYIAINDGFDTINQGSSSNDIAPFKNLLNDMYAKDISKKIRSAKKAKAIAGANAATCAPFGYKKDPADSLHLIIDEDTAWIVRKVYNLYLDGMGMRNIMNYLRDQKIMIPSARLHYEGKRSYTIYGIEENEDRKYRWSTDMVARILHNESYIGSSVHYRCIQPTHKSKVVRNKKENYMIIPNTHEAIISVEDFTKVQERLKLKAKTGQKLDNVLIGIVKCADCHSSMTMVHTKYRGVTDRFNLKCRKYSQFGKGNCTAHFTNYPLLCKALVMAINDVIASVQADEKAVTARLKKELNKQISDKGNPTKRLATIEKRLREISNLLEKIYEDRISGRLKEENFQALSEKYQTEQEQLQTEKSTLAVSVQSEVDVDNNISEFILLCKTTFPITELTEEIAHEFLDKVYIHSVPPYSKQLDIDIHFNFIGNVRFTE